LHVGCTAAATVATRRSSGILHTKLSARVEDEVGRARKDVALLEGLTILPDKVLRSLPKIERHRVSVVVDWRKPERHARRVRSGDGRRDFRRDVVGTRHTRQAQHSHAPQSGYLLSNSVSVFTFTNVPAGGV
jgi:hypothetical protein